MPTRAKLDPLLRSARELEKRTHATSSHRSSHTKFLTNRVLLVSFFINVIDVGRSLRHLLSDAPLLRTG